MGMDEEWWNTIRDVDGISVLSTLIQCILLIIIIIIGVITWRYVLNPSLRNYRMLTAYSISISLINSFCCITAISSIITSILMQSSNRASSFLFVGLTLLFYSISLSSLYLLFIFRIHLMLKNSNYSISLFMLLFLFFLFILMIILQFILLYLISKSETNRNWKLIDILSFFMFFCFYFGSTIIIILFIIKLKLLLVNPDLVELSDATTKMSLLILVSIITSSLIWIAMSTEWMFPTIRFITYMYDVLIVLDCAQIVLCTYCSFPFGLNVYDKIFGKLHEKFKHWAKP